MNRTVWAAGLTCVLVTGCGSGGGNDASCVAPYLDAVPPGGPYGAPPPTVAPGGTVTIHGHWYTSTCNDTGDDAQQPLPAVHLTATLPDGRAVPLGMGIPDGEDRGFAVSLHLPTDTPPGTVRVRDDRDPAATYRFPVASPDR